MHKKFVNKTPFEKLYLEPSRNGVYKRKEFHGYGYKIVNMGEIFKYDFIINQDMKRVSLTDTELSSNKLLDGDLIFARRSLVEEGVGKCSIILNPSEATTFESSIIRVRLDKNKALPKFYYYYFKSPLGRSKISSISTGVNIKGIRGSELKNLEVLSPPLRTQHKIASILSAYDDLIENNTRRIQILEEMAQRIYREWFVKFRYPGHENHKLVESELGMIPEGWEVDNIGRLYSVKSGYAFKSKQMQESGNYGIIKIKNIQSNSIDIDNVQFIMNENVDDRAFGFSLSAGDLLIAMTGAQVGKIGVMPKSTIEFLLNQRVGKFYPKKDFLKENQFLYQVVNTELFQTSVFNIAQGAAQPNISGSQIESIETILPPDRIIVEYEKLCQPFKELKMNLIYKNQILRKKRDLLLPKLISGKLDVSELDIDTGIEE